MASFTKDLTIYLKNNYNLYLLTSLCVWNYSKYIYVCVSFLSSLKMFKCLSQVKSSSYHRAGQMNQLVGLL